MEKENLTERQKLHQELVAHIGSKGEGHRGSPSYRNMLSKVSGANVGTISTMMNGYLPSFKNLVAIKKALARVDRAFGEIQIYNSQNKYPLDELEIGGTFRCQLQERAKVNGYIYRLWHKGSPKRFSVNKLGSELQITRIK